MRVFRERLSICVFASFPFGFGGGVWDLVVLVPDHCLSFYFANSRPCDVECTDLLLSTRASKQAFRKRHNNLNFQNNI